MESTERAPGDRRAPPGRADCRLIDSPTATDLLEDGQTAQGSPTPTGGDPAARPCAPSLLSVSKGLPGCMPIHSRYIDNSLADTQEFARDHLSTTPLFYLSIVQEIHRDAYLLSSQLVYSATTVCTMRLSDVCTKTVHDKGPRGFAHPSPRCQGMFPSRLHMDLGIYFHVACPRRMGPPVPGPSLGPSPRPRGPDRKDPWGARSSKGRPQSSVTSYLKFSPGEVNR